MKIPSFMKKDLSIVKVDTRHYRTIAMENWGLTREQMRGMHVHHRKKRSEGGTNDPTNLYVCSEWFHDNVWHEGEGGFAGLASRGASAAHAKKGEDGKSELAVRAGGLGGAKSGRRSALKGHEEKTPEGKSVRAIEMAKKSHAEKDEQGRSVVALRASRAGNAKDKRKNRTPIVLVDVEWGVILLFGSYRDAADFIGADPANLRKACMKGKTCKGFKVFKRCG